jgi:hypothetical protein
MSLQLALRPGLATAVQIGGQPVQVANAQTGPGGGWVINPYAPGDQLAGLAVPELLYVSLIGPFPLLQEGGPFEVAAIPPGGVFHVPPGCPAWVSAITMGHRFTAIFLNQLVQPVALPGAFNPTGPTGMIRAIPSYVYQEYSDDDDLQAFVRAYNAAMQLIVDAFNALNLPVYTSPLTVGYLLDWVGEGIYGYRRPYVFAARERLVGPLNTYWPNFPVAINMLKVVMPDPGALVSNDDLYKRCLTWHLFKGDGKYFNVRWLKRRVMRFLLGSNGHNAPIGTGSAGLDDTSQISVTFGTNYNVTIRFVLYVRTIYGGALPNRFAPNRLVNPAMGPIHGTAAVLNSIRSTLLTLPRLPYMSEFQMAVNSGVLELPFQFKYTVVIG